MTIYEFFYEGNGFYKRGLNNSIMIEEYIEKLEKDNKLLEQRGSDILKELLDKNKKCIELEQQIEKMKRHCNCKHRDSEGYCEVKRTYLIDLSYDGCDKWELED